jgi:hypothetical protein
VAAQRPSVPTCICLSPYRLGKTPNLQGARLTKFLVNHRISRDLQGASRGVRSDDLFCIAAAGQQSISCSSKVESHRVCFFQYALVVRAGHARALLGLQSIRRIVIRTLGGLHHNGDCTQLSLLDRMEVLLDPSRVCTMSH